MAFGTLQIRIAASAYTELDHVTSMFKLKMLFASCYF
jgi:hypothetical protein